MYLDILFYLHEFGSSDEDILSLCLTSKNFYFDLSYYKEQRLEKSYSTKQICMNNHFFHATKLPNNIVRKCILMSIVFNSDRIFYSLTSKYPGAISDKDILIYAFKNKNYEIINYLFSLSNNIVFSTNSSLLLSIISCDLSQISDITAVNNIISEMLKIFSSNKYILDKALLKSVKNGNKQYTSFIINTIRILKGENLKISYFSYIFPYLVVFDKLNYLPKELLPIKLNKLKSLKKEKSFNNPATSLVMLKYHLLNKKFDLVDNSAMLHDLICWKKVLNYCCKLYLKTYDIDYLNFMSTFRGKINIDKFINLVDITSYEKLKSLNLIEEITSTKSFLSFLVEYQEYEFLSYYLQTQILTN